jgi:putative hydrolase of the HAD superfamily
MSREQFDPRSVRWIAFDAVGTLIRPNPSAGAIYHRVGARHRSLLSAAEVTARFRDVFARVSESDDLKCGCAEAVDRLHTCEARERLKWRQIVRLVLDDVAAPDACFEELFAHFGRPDSWACFPEVGASLRKLRQAGYRLAVCSNFDSRLNAVMEGLPELAPIELRIISSEVKYRKPSGRFFEALIRSADCTASEILFVGDDPTNDVAAAHAAGLAALQIDRKDASVQNRTLRSLDELVGRLT